MALSSFDALSLWRLAPLGLWRQCWKAPVLLHILSGLRTFNQMLLIIPSKCPSRGPSLLCQSPLSPCQALACYFYFFRDRKRKNKKKEKNRTNSYMLVCKSWPKFEVLYTQAAQRLPQLLWQPDTHRGPQSPSIVNRDSAFYSFSTSDLLV